MAHFQPFDDLFLLPSAPVVAPMAYWLHDKTLTSAIMLIEPSEAEFGRLRTAMGNRTKTDFDMELVNKVYGGRGDADSTPALVPQEDWILSGEFRSTEHTNYGQTCLGCTAGARFGQVRALFGLAAAQAVVARVGQRGAGDAAGMRSQVQIFAPRLHKLRCVAMAVRRLSAATEGE